MARQPLFFIYAVMRWDDIYKGYLPYEFHRLKKDATESAREIAGTDENPFGKPYVQLYGPIS